MSDDALAVRALELWDLPGAKLRLAARRENVVYRAESGRGVHALRLHRPGMRGAGEIAAELEFMAAMAGAGLRVPAPLPAKDGALWQDVEGRLVSVLSWAPGASFGADTPRDERAAGFRALGREMARLHEAADGWSVPAGFERHAWDLDGLTGPRPLWGRCQDHPALSAVERALLEEALAAARGAIRAAKPDYGLIHADLLIENVLFDQGRPWLIDWDDSGWGYRLFDLATTILRAAREPDFDAAREALIEGYLAERALDMTLLDTFTALRAFTYLGWITERMGEPGAAERSGRFVETSLRLARALLHPSR